MSKQIISISPDGTISGLQVKPGRGFDMRSLGTARIERASEVIWDEEVQRWFVEIRKGKHTGRRLTWGMCVMAGAIVTERSGKFPTWAEYDDAVAAEIAVLDHIRYYEGAEALQ